MKILLAGLLLGLAAPSLAAAAPMPVYGVSTDDRGVTIRLAPGCPITRSDFTVSVDRSERPTLLVTRKTSALIKPVACGTRYREDAAPQRLGVAFTWSYDELGLRPGQAFSVANPLATAP